MSYPLLLNAVARALAAQANGTHGNHQRRAAFRADMYSAMSTLGTPEQARLMYDALTGLENTPKAKVYQRLLFASEASAGAVDGLDNLPHGSIQPWPGNFVHVEIKGEFCYTSLRRHLAAIKAASGVDLVLDSLGGSAGLALELYNALRDKSHSTGTVQGCACSAAAFTFLGCRHRRICRNAYLMFHNPACAVYGTSEVLRAEADNTADFQRACGEILHAVSPAVASVVMDGQDHYFRPREALHFNLVHEIVDPPAYDQLCEVFGLPVLPPTDPDADAETVLIEILSRLRSKFQDPEAFQDVLKAFAVLPLESAVER